MEPLMLLRKTMSSPIAAVDTSVRTLLLILCLQLGRIRFTYILECLFVDPRDPISQLHIDLADNGTDIGPYSAQTDAHWGTMILTFCF